MKPKLGSNIYTIYQDQIYLEVVGYIGIDSFIVEGFEDKTDAEYYYDEYKERWFRTLESAKKHVAKVFREKYHCKVKIEKITADTWECYDEEEE